MPLPPPVTMTVLSNSCIQVTIIATAAWKRAVPPGHSVWLTTWLVAPARFYDLTGHASLRGTVAKVPSGIIEVMLLPLRSLAVDPAHQGRDCQHARI